MVNRSLFPQTFGKELDQIFLSEYQNQKVTYNQWIKTGSAPEGMDYTEGELSNLGNLVEKGEGHLIQFDRPAEGHKKTIDYTSFSLGTTITREAYKDDRWGGFKKLPQMLGRSAAFSPEIEVYKMLQEGITGEQKARDGENFFYASHPLLKSSSTSRNLAATGADISQTTIEAAYEHFDDILDNEGRPIMSIPRYLIAPLSKRFEIARTLGSEKNFILPEYSSAYDPNVVNPGFGEVNGLTVILVHKTFMTNENNWFMLADNHDLRLWWKENWETDGWDDKHTKSYLYSVYGRFATFGMDWRGSFANAGV